LLFLSLFAGLATDLKIDITTSVMLKLEESSQRSAAEANLALENLTEELQGNFFLDTWKEVVFYNSSIGVN
jgi:hypothetical protein